ncbi:PREDICTED: uncharacterized protein LOC109244601 [Nicotiana attenuata]|uniref:uncharacterized protein LOC109244601 n=1 Tax=Nicotiana attenuata TaxID=49451 RepID=UPI000905AA15|nr:PREDICTED: uncharacterized protein LOC109244601 [Nicotiana attenuata]
MKANQRHATSKLISGYIFDNLRDPRFEVTPAFVIAEMQKLHGLDIGFLYMFYAYGSSISGWNHCRSVIAVDATFLKSKFRGVLMISVSKDANNQIFQLAFGIAESENNNSYEWYFSELRNAIGSRENLIFLSDRDQAIAYAIAKVYPESHHGICIYHLEQNIKQRKVKSEVIKLFQTAARVYRRKEFDLYMSNIAKVDKKTYDYLMEEPPERRNETEGTFYDVSCWVEEELKKKIDLAFTLNVYPVDSWHSRVEEEGITFLVDLNKRTCNCFQFQFDELPCIHAIAAIEKRNIKKSNFCSH